ncbi:MAG: hypothetical protein H6922_05770 [Pseudomonadaceae bacterium]|nr:hypothetical protein [Pseudomonadaceae bacterium]
MVLKRKLPSRVEQPQQAAAAPVPETPASSPPSQPVTPQIPAETPPTTPPEVPAETPPTEVPPPAAEPEVPAPLQSATEQPLEVSRPDGGSKLKRRVREKTARSFSSPAPAASQAPSAPGPMANPAVPQTDVAFDKVKDKLAGLGVVQAETDTLTQKAAPAIAEMEMPAQESVQVDVPPAPAPKKPSAEPDWLAELTRELNKATEKEDRDHRRDALGLPPPPTLPGNLLSGLIEDEGSAAPSYTPSVPEPKQPEPAALPPSPAAPSAAPTASSSQSDVPWAATDTSKDDWQLDMPAAKEASSLPPSPTQPADIYAGVGKDSTVPPWQQGSHGQPAELPGPRNAFASHGGSPARLATTAIVLVLVAAGVWWLVSRGDKTQEQLARMTGSLRETTENLPANLGGAQNGLSNQGVVQPEQTIGMNNGGLLPPPAESPAEAPAGNMMIDFADVPPEQAGKPIVADGDETMPEEVGLIASLQKAIAEKKAERSGEIPAPGATTTTTAPATTGNPALDKTIRNTELKAQLDAELAAYRHALVEAGNVAEAPRPSDFLGKSAQPATPYMNATAPTSGEGLQAPPATAANLPPAQSYGDNPSNLPVLAEPSVEAPRVRTLEDFDVAMFEPDREKVRIPRGIKPRMSTSDFPEMEVLSMVPGKGLIAYHNGTEGVLLLGESVDGWQLVQVGPDTAEFRNGQRNYYVNAE